jgi:hypothetical protein
MASISDPVAAQDASLPQAAGAAERAAAQQGLADADGVGVVYNKQKLHKVGYFMDSSSKSGIIPALRLRQTLHRTSCLVRKEG